MDGSSVDRRDAPTIEIRPGDPAALDVTAMLAESEAHSRALYPPESCHVLDVAALATDAVRFRVARSPEGAALGCGAYVPDGAGAAELKRMWVTPAVRGRGIGAAILTRLEAEARTEGIRVMRLETGVAQPEAIGLYRRFGYRERGPFGAYRPDPLSVFMEKHLADAAGANPSAGAEPVGSDPHHD